MDNSTSLDSSSSSLSNASIGGIVAGVVIFIFIFLVLVCGSNQVSGIKKSGGSGENKKMLSYPYKKTKGTGCKYQKTDSGGTPSTFTSTVTNV